jgi:hypothetical protein
MKTLAHWYRGLAGQPISFDPATPQMNSYLAALERKREAAVMRFTPRSLLTKHPRGNQYDASAEGGVRARLPLDSTLRTSASAGE